MRFGLLALVSAATMLAQQPPLPELRVEPTAGGSVLFIHNTGAVPLTAYLIELVDYPGSAFTLAQDELLGGEPIPPGGEKRTQVTNMTIGAVPDYVKMQAAIYADGSTSGSAEKIAHMLGRRRAQLEGARELIGRLTAASSMAKSELMEAIGKWADSLKPAGKPNQSSPAWVNQAAKHSFVMYFKAHLDAQAPADVLSEVRAAEAKLASSKPILEDAKR